MKDWDDFSFYCNLCGFSFVMDGQMEPDGPYSLEASDFIANIERPDWDKWKDFTWDWCFFPSLVE